MGLYNHAFKILVLSGYLKDWVKPQAVPYFRGEIFGSLGAVFLEHLEGTLIGKRWKLMERVSTSIYWISLCETRRRMARERREV